MVGAASAYVEERGGRLFVTASPADEEGKHVLSGHVELPPDADAVAIGAAVLAALDAKAAGREAAEAAEAALFAAAGVRTWGQYYGGLRSVLVYREGWTLRVYPKRNEGPRHGLSLLVERERRFHRPQAARLGEAVLDALALAVPYGDVPAAAPRGAPASFGYKCRWLALRSDDPSRVADVLGLADVRPASWQELEQTTAVFVTPPVDGWILVVLADGLDPDLAALSHRFGEAQFFGSHRVSDYYEWQRWVDGAPVRRLRYADGEADPDDGETDLDEIDEETVLDVARAWSVDPTTLSERSELPDEGLLGRYAKK